MPVVLAYFGITTTAAKTWSNPTDLLLIVVGAAISVALGVPRGATIRVWIDEDGRWWRQGSKATLALWGALFVARGGLFVIAQATGHQAAVWCRPSAVRPRPQLRRTERRHRSQDAAKLRTRRPGVVPDPGTRRPAEGLVPWAGHAVCRPPGPCLRRCRAAGSIHERAEQRRAERRARRAAREGMRARISPAVVIQRAHVGHVGHVGHVEARRTK